MVGAVDGAAGVCGCWEIDRIDTYDAEVYLKGGLGGNCTEKATLKCRLLPYSMVL
jgi:hypothetical protein